MSDKSQIYQHRLERLTNAVELKHGDRVPIHSLIDNWALFNYPTTLKDARTNLDLEYAAYSKATTEAYFDTISFPGITMPLNFMNSLGGGIYSDEMETIQIETGLSEIMLPEEYPKLIANPRSFFVNEILPRKHKIFQSGTMEEKYQKLAHSLSFLFKYFHDRGVLVDRFKTEQGLPVIEAIAPFAAGDLLLDSLRDFSGSINDIKRKPKEFAEACMAITEQFTIPTTFAALVQPTNDKYLHMFLHLPPFIRAKDFEKVYWPSFKKYIETFAQKGYKFAILFEKNWSHLYDYLQELPAGCILGFFEEDDLKVVKAKLSKNMCIAGGISTNDLTYKSPQECIDVAKKIIDEVAPGGGFVFSTDKVLLGKNDANKECLIAVNEFVHEYGVYK
ncbi:uroporphyrinogen decarboxylase family protein [Acetobacterium bakii]|uniref:Uroporphyrinogen decarboxylase (URO-D) domain-containing protein n=1 Tax=Acetobacterium bakii TaxID=52689 RepID=A0A0L6TZI5_9FIRM|nr:uroporphyrinogen decarboxylase family protein [Acetobacterium bakii]KNZ41487.1 hypothetical protein AKG39_11720 [Acetobacterium bakii]